MAEYRVGRGWTERELEDRLAALDALPLGFDDTEEEMSRSRGWNRYRSEAQIARESPGIPLPTGAFARARELVAAYAFSDPRIVTCHIDPESPLVGRRMLLEFKVLGLRFLGGVLVDAVHDSGSADRTTWGFRYATLEGHPESGAEWFVLTKEHRTGEIRFAIRACWRRGALPNWWSRLGFSLLVTRYQRAWHRLAYLRLRTFLGASGLPPLPRGEHLLHTGPRLSAPRVQRVAGLAWPTEIAYEHEERGGADDVERH
jgi:uncharacterized protein (UPF0548 family)